MKNVLYILRYAKNISRSEATLNSEKIKPVKKFCSKFLKVFWVNLKTSLDST